jgi:hypothetical protein
MCYVLYQLQAANRVVPLKFNEEEGQYKAVVKFFKSKESIARFIKTTPKIFDPILPGLVLYGIMESA